MGLPMHSTVTDDSVATTTPLCDRPVICTPQRKANYNDKARLRRKDLKEIAFNQCGWKSTANVKKYLKVLGLKLDLRLTSAWVALLYELKHQVDAAKAIVDALEKPQVTTKMQEPPLVFSTEEEAMNYYLNKYSPVQYVATQERGITYNFAFNK